LFSNLSKFHVFLAFLAIIALRLVVGFHFYKEGITKLDNGFSAEYFLKGAKGPFAETFHSMADDSGGMMQLCVKKSDSESANFEIDPNTTLAVWDDFVGQASDYYGFGSVQLLEKMEGELNDLKAKGDEAAFDATKLSDRIETLKGQQDQAQLAFLSHKRALLEWITYNRVPVLAYYGTEGRLSGFNKDGASREKVAVGVESLREQVDSIRKDRSKELSKWKTEVSEIWDSFEGQINSIAVKEQQRDSGPLPLHRPFDQSTAKLSWINKIIPWFDCIVGVLLILGLFTRFASLAAGLFLFSVLMTQPFWVPGTDPTYYQAIEMVACFVLFATCAGRFGGLDYFFAPKPQRPDLQS